MTKQALLQALGLIAATQALEASDRAKNAELQNQVAQFKKDHDLVNDEEVNTALSAVLRAAETAPPSADATAAATVTAPHLDDIGTPAPATEPETPAPAETPAPENPVADQPPTE